MRSWYVVRTQAHMETRAKTHLTLQGYQVFLPLRVKTRRHARKIETVLRPLFPGYLFVCLDVAVEQWRPINGTVGVLHLITADSRPCPVPDGITEGIIARADERDVVKLQTDQFRAGDRVMISNGSLRGCEAFFQEAIDENRVLLLLDLLGRKVRTWVHVDAL